METNLLLTKRPAKRDPGPRKRPFHLAALDSGKLKLTSKDAS